MRRVNPLVRAFFICRKRRQPITPTCTCGCHTCTCVTALLACFQDFKVLLNDLFLNEISRRASFPTTHLLRGHEQLRVLLGLEVMACDSGKERRLDNRKRGQLASSIQIANEEKD